MSTEAAKFFVDWLDENVTGQRTSIDLDVSTLAERCLSEAAERGIARGEIEAVAGKIEDTIQDEIEYLNILRSMSPSQFN